MPDDAPFVKCIVFSATTDVVNDQGPTATAGFVGNDADVIEAVVKLSHHDVAGAPLRTSPHGR